MLFGVNLVRVYELRMYLPPTLVVPIRDEPRFLCKRKGRKPMKPPHNRPWPLPNTPLDTRHHPRMYAKRPVQVSTAAIMGCLARAVVCGAARFDRGVAEERNRSGQ